MTNFERVRSTEYKSLFVFDISKVIKKNETQFSIDNIYYDAFIDKYGSLQEYIIICYKGGAKAARNCNGDSLGAILEEITHYLYSGAPSNYYDGYEVYEYYQKEFNDSLAYGQQ